MKEIKPDYSQTFLLPPALEDWVGDEHPARFVRDFVDSLDLQSLGFKGRRSPDGRPSYSDDLLLKIWIFGYFNDVRSTRKLERACREMMGFLWLSGMLVPDHNTLWRFFHRYPDAIQNVFVETVTLAAEAKLLNMAVHAVDGTKIRARCSDGGALNRRQLTKALTEEEKRIAEYMEDVARAEEEEEGQYRLPDELLDAEARKKWIKERLEKLRSNGIQSEQPNEPDARQMKRKGAVHFSFNAQAVVDVESGLVVASDVTNAQNDSYQLVPMARMARENLGSDAEELLADAGYATLPEIGEMYNEGTSVTVDLPRRLMAGPDDSDFHASRFRYDEDNDIVMCPLGKPLRFMCTKDERHGRYLDRIYRCRGSKECPRQPDCCGGKNARVIQVSPYQKALQAQRDKYKDPEKRHASRVLRKRVETLFGQVKANCQFNRFSCWGLINAKAQWSLLCAAGNLRKLHRIWIHQPTERTA
jgi:transposase